MKFKIIFTTNYILHNKNQSNYIQNIQDLTDQVNILINIFIVFLFLF